MGVKRLVKKYNTITCTGIEPRPLDPESSALFIMSLTLPVASKYGRILFYGEKNCEPTHVVAYTCI